MSMPVISPSATSRRQAITDIIESLALQQTALAHILNAEGEKLQRIVGCRDISFDRIIATNKSVEALVCAVTRLEMVLQSKLALFENCLCEDSILCDDQDAPFLPKHIE